MAKFNRIAGKMDSLRDMLIAAGIGDFNATLSIPYMYFLPRTCDPYAQATMQIVEGLQNLLHAKGAPVAIDGWMGPPTIAALVRYAGPGWKDKTWMQLYGDVIRGRVAPGHEQPAGPDLSGYVQETGLQGFTDLVTGLFASPVAWVAGGAAAYYLLRGKRANPARRRA